MKREMNAGFTAVELLVTIVVIAVLILLLAVPAGKKLTGKQHRIQCVNNLKSIGLGRAVGVFDARGEILPGEMLLNEGATNITASKYYAANEISVPVLLHCPADTNRTAASSFRTLTDKNISYFANLTARETHPASFLFGDRNLQLGGIGITGLLNLSTNTNLAWSAQIHSGSGNIAMGDGSVQQMNDAGLQQALQKLAGTNLLVFP